MRSSTWGDICHEKAVGGDQLMADVLVKFFAVFCYDTSKTYSTCKRILSAPRCFVTLGVTHHWAWPQ